MERTELKQLTGLSDSKLDTKLNEIGALPQFQHLGINAFTTTIPQEIVDFIVSQNQPKQLPGKVPAKRKTSKGKNTAKQKTDELSIQSMSIDTSALDTMEPSQLEAQLNNIDNARTSHTINQSNTHSQQENITNEELIQANIEGTLTGELAGITYLQSHHKAKQKVLREYSQFQNQNHNKYVQSVLGKYGEINSELSEEIAKESHDYAEQNTQMRKSLLGKLNN